MEVDILLEYGNRRQLRRWLEDNHEHATHCWVAAYRSRVPEGVALPYLEIVEEALCFGWIDSTNKKLPDGRLAQRISPRRKGSHWTELNMQRCADLGAFVFDSGGSLTQKLSLNMHRTRTWVRGPGGRRKRPFKIMRLDYAL